MPENIKAAIDTVISWGLNTGIKVIIALIALFISFKLINWFGKKSKKDE